MTVPICTTLCLRASNMAHSGAMQAKCTSPLGFHVAHNPGHASQTSAGRSSVALVTAHPILLAQGGQGAAALRPLSPSVLAAITRGL